MNRLTDFTKNFIKLQENQSYYIGKPPCVVQNLLQ